jgi:filamentous hemagglutinin family protein
MRCFARSVKRVISSSGCQVIKTAQTARKRCCSLVRSVNSELRTQNAKLCAALKSHTKEWAAAALAAGLFVSPYMVDAAPQGGVVVGGEATIAKNGAVTNITQASQRAAIDWSSFDIAKHETVNFQQPNASAVALNRIVGNNPSAIYGQLNANGVVYLANPNGMYFASGAQVNVAGLIATTSHVDPLAFMQTGLINTGERNGTINMQGSIFASGGLVEIKGATAINVGGLIQAATINGNGGTITIGNNAALDVNGASLLARGSGANSGGFIETSGDVVAGLNNVTVNAGSDNGTAGTWLIDPVDYNIGGTGSNMTGEVLGNSLNTQNMTIRSSDGTGGTSGDVNVFEPVNWTANNSLTLSAVHDVNVAASINNSGTGSVILRADNTGIGYVGITSGGTVNFSNGATIGLLNASTGGYAKIYYNPANYSTPTDYSANVSAANGHGVAYMLVNQLGSSGDIISVHSLAAISNNYQLWNKNFAFGQDVDATVTRNWNNSAGFIPLGNATYNQHFTGKFDGGIKLTGGSYSLSNLFINRTATYVGLFGYLYTGATISNLNLSNANITGYSTGGNFVGSVAGLNSNATITNINLSGGTISGGTNTGLLYVGGVVGRNNYASPLSGVTASGITVSGSSSTGQVHVGGIIGQNNIGMISGVTVSTATISGNNVSTATVNVGGIAGSNAGSAASGVIDGAVVNSTTVSGSGGDNSHINDTNVGGVVGERAAPVRVATVSNVTINSRNASGSARAGGVVGRTTGGGVYNGAETQVVVNDGEITLGYTSAGTIESSLSGATATITQVSETTLTIGASTVNTGGLTITATGLLTQSNAITAAGITNIVAGSNSIALMNVANDFYKLRVTGGMTQITEANGIAMDGASVFNTGNATILARNGNLSFSTSGGITVNSGGNLYLAATDGNIINNSTSGASTILMTGGGRYILWSNSGTDTFLNGLTPTNAGINGTYATKPPTGEPWTAQPYNIGNYVMYASSGSSISGSLLGFFANSSYTIDLLSCGALLGNTTITTDGTGQGAYFINYAAALNSPFMVYVNNRDYGGTAAQTFVTGTSYNINKNILNTSVSSMSDLRGILTSGSTIYIAGNLPYSYSVGSKNIDFHSGVGLTVSSPQFTVDGNITTTAANQTYSGAVMAISAATLSTRTSGGINFAGNLTATVAPLNIITTGGTINVGGIVNSTGQLLTLKAGSGHISAINSGNDFSVLSLTGGQAAVRDVNGLTLAASTLTDVTDYFGLTVTANGSITQSGALAVSGKTTLMNSGNTIALDNISNNFNKLNLTASGASIRDTNNLYLAGAIVGGSGSLLIITGGDLTQGTNSGEQVDAGDVMLTANGSISLQSSFNSFDGILKLNAAAARVRQQDNKNLTLGATNITGTGDNNGLAVYATRKTISQAPGSNINVTSWVGFNNPAGIISLLNTGNSFGGTLSVSGYPSDQGPLKAEILAAGPVTLGSCQVLGNFLLTAGGNVSQSTSSSLKGGITVSAPGFAVDLSRANFIENTVSVTGSSANINAGSSGVIVGNMLLGSGNLTLQNYGQISQSGIITAGGLTVGASGSGYGITLNSANVINGPVSASFSGIGNHAFSLKNSSVTAGQITVAASVGTLSSVAITYSNAGLNIAEISGSGIASALNIRAGGAITQTAAITAGSTTINAGSNAVTLVATGNDFSSLALTGSSASVVDQSGLTFTASALGAGGLAVTAGGSVIVDGASTLAGTGIILANNGNLSFTTSGKIAVNSGGNLYLAATSGNIVNNSTLGASAISMSGATPGRYILWSNSSSGYVPNGLTANTPDRAGTYATNPPTGEPWTTTCATGNYVMFATTGSVINITGSLLGFFAGSSYQGSSYTVDLLSGGLSLGHVNVTNSSDVVPYTITYNGSLSSPFMVYVENFDYGGNAAQIFNGVQSYNINKNFLNTSVGSMSDLRGILTSGSTIYTAGNLPYSYTMGSKNIDVHSGVGLSVSSPQFTVDGNITTSGAGQTYASAVAAISAATLAARNSGGISFAGNLTATMAPLNIITTGGAINVGGAINAAGQTLTLNTAAGAGSAGYVTLANATGSAGSLTITARPLSNSLASALTVSGTISAGYKIYDRADLDNVHNNITSSDNYTLENSFTAGATAFTPIGAGTAPFKGIFDGHSNNISGLHINQTAQNVGLFGVVGSGATVRSLHLIDADITGFFASSNLYVGGVAGQNVTGAIIDVTVTGGTIGGSSDSAAVYAGGVAGYNDYGIISSDVSVNDTSISGNGGNDVFVGGVAGKNGSGIINADTRAAVYDGSIALDYASGSGGTISAALTGTSATITQINESTLTIRSALISTGGLAISGAGAVTQYNAMTITGDTTINAGSHAITLESSDNDFGKLTLSGGIVSIFDKDDLTFGASNLSNLSASASGFSLSDNITATSGLTLNAFSSGGIAGHINFAAGKTATVLVGSACLTSRPLASTATSLIGASGGIYGTYTVADYTDFNNVRNDLSANADYTVYADVNAAGQSFIPIGGADAFLGRFDGQGHTISNVIINIAASTASNVGMFGSVGIGAAITSLGLSNITVRGSNTNFVNYVGGLVGYSDGGIIRGITGINVNVSGTNIGGNTYVGGIVGNKSSGLVHGVILNNLSVSGATDSGNVYAGGIAGFNTGNILHISADNATVSGSSVSGLTNVGGVAGVAVNSGCQIQDVNFSSMTISGSGPSATVYAGGVVGSASGGLIQLATLSTANIFGGSASGFVQVGGLAGRDDNAAIDHCMLVNVAVSGNSVNNYVEAGGVAGEATGAGITIHDVAIVSNSEVDGSSDSGHVSVGGAFGKNGVSIADISVYNSVISGSNTSTGTVNIGGIAGENYGSISGSEGNHLTISGSNLSLSDVYAGGAVGVNFSVLDGVTISASTISGSGTLGLKAVGGVAGKNYIGDIRNSTVTGTTITASNSNLADIYAGGIAGLNNNASISAGRISGVAVNANSTSGAVYVGGIAGANGVTNATLTVSGGNISDSAMLHHSSVSGVSHSGDIYAGGIAGNNTNAITNDGVNYFGVVSGQSNTGTVYVGGLAGRSTAAITSSFVSNTSVSGVNVTSGNVFVGGVAGLSTAADDATAVTIDDILANIVYVTGTVAEGNVYVGGIAGKNNIVSITNSEFSHGSIIGSGNAVSTGATVYVGGFAGINIGGAISNSSINSASMSGVGLGDNDANQVRVGGIAGESSAATVNVWSTISNVTVSGVTINASNINDVVVGGIVGLNYQGSDILNNTVDGGSISGRSTAGYRSTKVGGVAGYNLSGISSNTVNLVNLYGSGDFVYLGGMAGENFSGAVRGAAVTGGVFSGTGNITAAVGGLVGSNNALLGYYSTISGSNVVCASVGVATAYAGGAAGYNTNIGSIDRVTTTNVIVSSSGLANSNVHIGDINGSGFSGNSIYSELASGWGTITGNKISLSCGSSASISSTGLTLGAATVAGDLSIYSTGTVVQSAGIGAANLTVNAGTNDVAMTARDNFIYNASLTGGNVALYDRISLNLGSCAVTSLALTAAGVTLAGGTISASATGAAIVLNSTENFANHGGITTLYAPNGRWLAYSTAPANDTRGGLVYSFKQYNASIGAAPLGTGNGFLYTQVPVVSYALGGSTTKTYDGNATVTNYGSISAVKLAGLIDGDSLSAASVTVANYDNKNAGEGKSVTATRANITIQNTGRPVYGYLIANAVGNIGVITAPVVDIEIAKQAAINSVIAASANANTAANQKQINNENKLGGIIAPGQAKAGNAVMIDGRGQLLGGLVITSDTPEPAKIDAVDGKITGKANELNKFEPSSYKPGQPDGFEPSSYKPGAGAGKVAAQENMLAGFEPSSFKPGANGKVPVQSAKQLANVLLKASGGADGNKVIGAAEARAVIKMPEPKNAADYFARANSQVASGEIANAVADYSKAIQDNPNYAEAYFNRAYVQAATGNNAAAIQDFRQAVAINPGLQARVPDGVKSKL